MRAFDVAKAAAWNAYTAAKAREVAAGRRYDEAFASWAAGDVEEGELNDAEINWIAARRYLAAAKAAYAEAKAIG